MKKFISIFAIVACMPFVAGASEISDAIANVRSACGGISDDMADMKTMAGINTAVTAVGTVAGGVALGTGIAKANVDAQVEEWERILEQLEKEQEAKDIQFSYIDSEMVKQALESENKAVAVNDNISELTEQSKTLGNVRTGTMAGAAATNVAGAIIAGTNKVKADLKSRINECIAATKTLSNVKMAAFVAGNADAAEVARAEKIVSACSDWEMVDLSKIDNRATGAMVSSAIGATTGIAGTITSASANSDAVRNDNSDTGKQREKNLNTASNVLAGTTTAASATATVFNATQISAIKRAATAADTCEGALN